MSTKKTDVVIKKQRVSLACDVCKKRKVKCDKGRPCSSCIKHKAPERCTYSDQSESINSMQASIANGQTMSFKIVSPPFNSNVSNFYNSSISDAPIVVSNNISSVDSRLLGPQDPLGQRQVQASFNIITNRRTETKEQNQNNDSGNTYLQSEIDRLKEKIKDIEASLIIKDFSKEGQDSTRQIYNLPSQPVLPLLSAAPVPIKPTNESQSDYPIFQSDLNSNQGHKFTEATSSQNSLHNMFQVFGINPVFSTDCEIDFFGNYTPLFISSSRIMNRGPFFWVTITVNDIGLSMTWKNMTFTQKTKQFFEVDPNGIGVFSHVRRENDEFRVRLMEEEGFADLRPYKNGKPKLLMPFGKKKTDFPMEFISNGKIDGEIELVKRLKKILPKQKVIWLLVDRFFNHVYGFMPFLDEEDFVTSISKLIGPRELNDSKIETLRIERRLDFAHLGILLYVLRLSYLSYSSNDSSINDQRLNTDDTSEEAQKIKYLLQNEVGTDVIHTAHMCLNQFKLLKKSSFLILQCALFSKLYEIYSPEEGDGIDGGEIRSGNAMLIQMAYSIGLNRDPDIFKDSDFEPKFANLWRKTWYQLVSLDITQSALTGSPIAIDKRFYDTKIPVYMEGVNENVKLRPLEKCGISFLVGMWSVGEKVCHILDLVLDIRKATKLHDLSRHMNDLENYIMTEYGSLNNLLTPLKCTDTQFDSNEKVSRVLRYMFIKNILCSLYWYYFGFYEKKNHIDLAHFYLKKLFASSFDEFLPNCHKMIHKNSEIFGNGYDLILTPFLESTYHKSILIVLASYVRIAMFLRATNNYHDKNELCHFSKLFSLKDTLMSKASKYIEGITDISNRYYYAWKMSRAHRYIFKMVTEDSFYSKKQDNSTSRVEKIFFDSPNVYECMSERDLDELLSIIENVDISTIIEDRSRFNKSVCDDANHKNGAKRSLSSLSEYNFDSEIDAMWLPTFTNYDDKYSMIAPIKKGQNSEMSIGSNFSGQRDPYSVTNMPDIDPFDIFYDIIPSGFQN